MTRPPPDPLAEAEALAAAQLKGDGRGCGGCRYLGFGPAIVVRCCHPERACFLGVESWALGCAARVERDAKFHAGRDPHPERVDLGEHCEALFRRRVSDRGRLRA